MKDTINVGIFGLGNVGIGGLSTAESIILESLKHGKSVVTANKALLAERGGVIFPAAHDARGCFGFETSVGTSVPIIRTLREGFAGDEILKISGILNGTSNTGGNGSPCSSGTGP